MTASYAQSDGSAIAASRSLWSITATVTLAAITHAYDFGVAAWVAGAIVIVLLFSLSNRYRRTGSRLAAVFYSLLSLWVIAGFGLVGGVWNHAVKIVLTAVNGGTVPAGLEPLFMDPELGSVSYEAFWVLLGIASVAAAFYGYRFVRTVRWTARADVADQGAV